CVPCVARADEMRVTSYDMDDSGGTVRLESNKPVGESWLRVDKNMVRVWFPHIVDIARFDHEREAGQPIRALALRAGANDTAVLRFELGANKHVNPSDVEVIRNGNSASVQIRVPGIKPIDEEEAPPAAAALPVKPQPQPQPLAAATKPTDTTGATDISAAKHSFLAPEMNELAKKESPQTMQYLLIATLILGLIFVGLQLFNKKKANAPKPQIEVLGARRLGHRQELLIVRALGSDHLLLCTGGRAERVASSPTPVPLALPANSQARPGEESQAGGLGLISRLSSHHRLRKLLDNVEQERLDGDEPLPAPRLNPFGQELVSASRKHAAVHSLPAPRGRQSEAVAGLDRLRKRAAT
ncbi:MAG TPA: hypothetical protein VGI70_00740, partial [Polyangiales bacterium]